MSSPSLVSTAPFLNKGRCWCPASNRHSTTTTASHPHHWLDKPETDTPHRNPPPTPPPPPLPREPCTRPPRDPPTERGTAMGAAVALSARAGTQSFPRSPLSLSSLGPASSCRHRDAAAKTCMMTATNLHLYQNTGRQQYPQIHRPDHTRPILEASTPLRRKCRCRSWPEVMRGFCPLERLGCVVVGAVLLGVSAWTYGSGCCSAGWLHEAAPTAELGSTR